MEETLETTEETEAAAGYGENPLGAMDPGMAANPQPVWQLMREEPVMSIDDLPSGRGVLLSRKEEIMEALRHPEIFSSNMDAVDLKNKRPMIPLQIDPPDHKKFRKLLDPIFAPRKMAVMDDEVSSLVNRSIDRFIDRGEVDFAKEFSIPFPSQVFLTLLGLPLEELDTFLTMKDGIIRPDHVTGKLYGSHEASAYQQKIADSVYDYFNKVLDLREKERKDDMLSHFLDAEVEGDRLTREDILDICFLFLIAGLDTVTATLDCMFAFLAQHPEQRQQLVEDPSLIPNAIEELLRWETPVMGIARVAVTGHGAQRLPDPCGRTGDGHDRLGQHGRSRVSPTVTSCASTATSTRTSRSAAASTAASGRTWPGWSCVSRCANGTSASPTTRWSPATSSSTRRASAPSTTSRCASPRLRKVVGVPAACVADVRGPAALVPVATLVAPGRVRIPA